MVEHEHKIVSQANHVKNIKDIFFFRPCQLARLGLETIDVCIDGFPVSLVFLAEHRVRGQDDEVVMRNQALSDRGGDHGFVAGSSQRLCDAAAAHRTGGFRYGFSLSMGYGTRLPTLI